MDKPHTITHKGRKFTLSKDGQHRCSIMIDVRLLKEEYDALEDYASKRGNSVKELLQKHFSILSIWDAIDDNDE